MNKWLLIISLTFLLLPTKKLQAQEDLVVAVAETVIQGIATEACAYACSGCISSMNYGGLESRFTFVGGAQSVLFGAKGGWSTGDNFGIGLAGYTTLPVLWQDATLPRSTMLTYGGLLLTPSTYKTADRSLAFPILIGAGGITSKNREEYSTNQQALFIFEPGISSHWTYTGVRFEVTATYRFVIGPDNMNAHFTSLWGPSVGVGISFGVLDD